VNLYPWQQSSWSRIDQLIQEDRLPHALLFLGHKGIGKRAMAERLAARLLCIAPEAGHPCQRCKTCQLIHHGSHPDLLHLSPEEEGKVIKVDPVRNTIDKLHGTAQQGGYRVLIIDPAEAMNVSAANALLKTLEEPGQNTMIILIVDQLGQVMPTIRSRCQRIECPMPSPDESVPWLADQLSMTPEKATGLLALAQGAPLTAHAWKSGSALELRAKLMGGLADILRGRVSAIALAETLQREDLRLPLTWWQSLLGDIVRIQVAGVEKPRVNADMSSLIISVAEKANPTRVVALYDSVQAELSGIERHQNPNKQLLLESLLFDWKELRAD